MELDDAYSLISSAIDTGHAANGYLVVGDAFRCERLVSRLLLKLFPDAAAQIESGAHPDVTRLEPEGARRIIKVDSMRERIVEPMSVTAFAGGWKVGVIAGADRMEAPTANAFLKILEEPPERTMFLLLTDAPDMILPTIVSRTQRVDLKLSSGLLPDDDRSVIAEIFESSGIEGTYAKTQAAKQLAELYEELKDRVEAEEGDVSAMRKSFYRTIVHYVRQWMVAERLPRYQVFFDIAAVEQAYDRSARLIPSDAVLAYMCDRMFFPS